MLTAEDVSEIPAIVTGLPREVVANSRPVLPAEKVRFVGEAVACVIATSRYVAEDAVQLIDVEYEQLPVVMDAEQALAEDAPLLHDGTESNSFAHIEVRARGCRWGVRGGRPGLLKRFHHGRFHALPLEGAPSRRLGRRNAGDDVLDVDADPALAPHARCRMIGLSEKQLRVISPDVGGAFGLKLHMWPEDYLVAAASSVSTAR